ncbi:MAG: hypothetical protein JST50_00430 [Bacteroidetes bacterium]|jgi:hypothetical protein|nr:hypothetical protein [Bacteroidota bacterium]
MKNYTAATASFKLPATVECHKERQGALTVMVKAVPALRSTLISIHKDYLEKSIKHKA